MSGFQVLFVTCHTHVSLPLFPVLLFDAHCPIKGKHAKIIILFKKQTSKKAAYQVLLCLADFCLKVFRFVMIWVTVCGAQATEEGGWKLEAFGLLLLLWRRLLLPDHLAV